MMLSPSRPVLFEPSPWRPRSALYSGLKRKWTSVLCCSLDSMTTSPPLPPSPPEGPPRGTNFSRRKAMQPFPPSPAFTRIFTSSINIVRQQIDGRAGLVDAIPRKPASLQCIESNSPSNLLVVVQLSDCRSTVHNIASHKPTCRELLF